MSQSPNDQRKTISGHAFRKQASELGIKQADESAAEQDTDFVLVEAPKPTIISCLASLNKDSANYVGINVDQSANAQARISEKSGSAKKLADDLTRFSRGIAPQQQAAADRYGPYYYGTETAAAPPVGSARHGDSLQGC